MAKKTPRKDINLYTLVVGQKKSTVKKGVLFAVLGVAAAVLLGGSYGAIRVYAGTQKKHLEEMRAKTEDTALLEKIAHVNELTQDIGIMRNAGNVYDTVQLEITQDARSACDNFTEDLVEQLVSCEEMSFAGERVRIAEITGLSYDGMVLSISASSENSRYISFFNNNLSKLGIFSEVKYSDYAFTETSYTYTINATFVEHTYETEESTEEATEN